MQIQFGSYLFFLGRHAHFNFGHLVSKKVTLKIPFQDPDPDSVSPVSSLFFLQYQYNKMVSNNLFEY